MSADLAKLLQEWPYEPGQLSVRMIEGDDGKPKIQLRLDLGILQMEMDGRPDGLQPDGHESLLELFESQLDERGGGVGGRVVETFTEETAPEEETAAFSLDSDACRLLREEAVQYYRRYVALFVLEEFDAVVRDTSRNLRVLDLCAQYAESEEDQQVLEQFRPYILMMRARAMASQAIKTREPKAAMLAIDDALERIRGHFEDIGEPQEYQNSNEVQLLEGMRDALAPKLPVGPKTELRERLDKAIEQENFELAAILRDELKMMKE